MDMKRYLNSIDEKERIAVAEKAGTTVGYLWQISGNHRKPGALLARKIERVTGGRVKASSLRPDYFCDDIE
jgi:DNA-binding transcriptional regulator YdaS (Cro superfamily)